MKVKAVEIARKLGISKSTVSMALNGKPGVSEQTRAMILECREQLENNRTVLPGTEVSQEENGRQIKVLLINKNRKSIRETELDLWSGVSKVFERMARERGYDLGIMHINWDDEKDFAEMPEICNTDRIAGVIVMGTELDPEDEKSFYSIHKPLVIYDCDLGSTRYSAVMVDNRMGAELAVDAFFDKGKKDIVYVGSSLKLYNFDERRKGFLRAMKRHGVRNPEVLTSMNCTIQDAYLFMKQYIEEKPLPQAFLMESYHVSVGTVRALREKGLTVPGDLSLIGIDEVPEYMTGDCRLTAVRIPHEERAVCVMDTLFREMDRPSVLKTRLFMNCELVKGETL